MLRIGSNEKGYLSFLEGIKELSFIIKRVYFVYGVPENIVRGFHAHKITDQIVFCSFGKIEILLDDGINKQTYILDNPEKFLLIQKRIWHEMKWLTKDSVLTVVASEKYNEEDYIRDYQKFIHYINNNN